MINDDTKADPVAESNEVPKIQNRTEGLHKQAWEVMYSNPRLALEFALSAQRTLKDNGDTKAEAITLRLLGNANFQLSNYSDALEYYNQSLFLSENTADIDNVAACTANIGNVYQMLGDFNQALKYYQTAIDLYYKIGDLHKIAAMQGNIGNSYGTLKKCRRALVYHFKALKTLEQLNDRQGVAFILGNIGNEYKNLGDIEKALIYYRQSYSISEEIGNKRLLVINSVNLGELNIHLNRFKRASLRLTQAMKIAKETGLRDQVMVIYKVFAELYEKQEKWKHFSKYFKMYHELEKELMNEAVQKKAAQLEMQKEIELKDKEAEIERLRNVELKKAFDDIEIKNEIIEKERIKSDKLLLNILPAEVAEELKENGTTKARHYDNVSVMFTDFKGFTRISEQLTAQELVDELHACFLVFDNIIDKFKLEKIKTIGDSYMAVSGLTNYDSEHAGKMIKVAKEISEFMKNRKSDLGEKTFEIRIGIHSGSVVAGVVGMKKFAFDIWGDTVNIAARMEQHCEPGKINISASTYDLVKNNFKCIHRGKIDVKNKGCVEMYYVE